MVLMLEPSFSSFSTSILLSGILPPLPLPLPLPRPGWFIGALPLPRPGPLPALMGCANGCLYGFDILWVLALALVPVVLFVPVILCLRELLGFCILCEKFFAEVRLFSTWWLVGVFFGCLSASIGHFRVCEVSPRVLFLCFNRCPFGVRELFFLL